ncbi:MAG: succinate--CoA ligase subunit alpha [Chloroflexi bacterium]|nr:succinate--CoA ligase subunit alpha [Chloroflexota bacterium]
MSILANQETRVLVQGITGNEGSFHTEQMMLYKTNIVAGVTPGKGGEWVLNGKIPVFDSVQNAVDVTGANASVIFVPAKFVAEAIFEAVDAEIPLVICITEGVPIQDMMRVKQYLQSRKTKLIGPNCPGIISPGEIKIGIIPGNISIPGNIGVISRSGTLTYEVLYALKKNNMGVSTCVGIGGDPVKGLGFVEILGQFEEDPRTDVVILIGEIGGNDEESASDFINRKMTKPVVAYIAGISAPIGKTMGHAGAIIDRNSGSAEAKIKSLSSVGVKIAQYPEEIPGLINPKN